MKKILSFMLSLILCFSLCGCSQSKTPDEVKNILEKNKYETTMSYKGKYQYVSDGDNMYVYHKEEDVLVYSMQSVKQDDSSIIVDLDNKKAVTFADGPMKINESITSENIQKVISLSDSHLKNMRITVNDIRNYLSSELNKKLDEFEELSNVEKLKLLYSDNSNLIEQMNEEQHQILYDMYVENNDASFYDLYEDCILNSSTVPKIVRDSIESLEYKSKAASINWDLQNMRYLDKNEDGNEGIALDWYLNGNDTNMDFIYMFCDGQLKVAGLSLGDGQSLNVDDSNSVIAMYMVLMKTIDQTIDDQQAIAIFAKASNETTSYNGYVYIVDIDTENRGITMIIMPESSLK